MLCDAAFWRAQSRDLADIAEPRVADYALADDIGAMAERALQGAPESFALAGHSMGGRVALEIWRRAPRRVRALALMATDFRGHPGHDARAAEKARRDAILLQLRDEGPRGFAQSWVREIVAPRRLHDAALVSQIVEMMARQGAEACAAQTLAGLNRGDQSAILPTISCPTLIVAGWEDALRPVEGHRDMAARIPQSRLVVLEECGHMVAMERPDPVSHAMRDWLGRA